MARSVRIQYEGTVYHVMRRGDKREAIFRDDKDREISGRKRHSYGGGLREHDEAQAGEMLAIGSKLLGVGLKEIVAARKNDARKQALAWLVKSKRAGDEWIVNRLNMGHRTNISRAVKAFREAAGRKRERLKKILLICTDCPEWR